MPNAFENRFNSYTTIAQQRAFGVSVTLTRGALVSDAITAMRDDIEFVGFGTETGTTGKATHRVYHLPVTECVLSATEVQPRSGDLITEGSDVWVIHSPDTTSPATELETGGFHWRCYAVKQ